MKLYHGTNDSRARIILKEGLKPMPINLRIWNKGGISKSRPTQRDRYVYLTRSLILALSYAKKAASKESCFPAILTVELPHTDNLRVDDDYLRISNPLDYKNWETSFLTMDQVAHEGEIQPNYLT
jgi:hypothetical protein